MLLSLLILTTTRARKTSVLWRAKMSISHARLMETPSRKSSGNMPIRKEGINWVMNWPFLRFLKELIAFISKCLTEVLRKGETLVIYNVTRYDMGYYMCIAKNGVPPARSKSIRVHVSCKYYRLCGQLLIRSVSARFHFLPVKPEVHIPNQVIGSPLRTNITLRCDVSAFPKPIMYWSDERGKYYIIKKAWKADWIPLVHLHVYTMVKIHRVVPKEKKGTANYIVYNSILNPKINIIFIEYDLSSTCLVGQQ